MLCTRRTSDLGLLLILTVFLMAECVVLGVEGPAPPNNSLMQQKDKENGTSVNTLLSVLVDTKAVLSCHPIPLTTLVLATWKIIFRDNTSCTRAYRKDTHETVETNCTDKGITWASSPDQNPALQIEPVAITHDGYYVCDMVTSEGNFMHGYHLQVLVPPKTTILLTAHRTVVCKAVAGKPAAQISWTPEGKCVTKQEDQGNDIVSVQSTCHWEEGNVSAVTCSVSHLTGNRSLSLDLHRVNTLLSVLVDTKAVLSCHPIPLTTLVLATWKIIFRDNTSCTRAYRKDTHETVETNCTDKGITSASSSDRNPALQIEPVAITHDGHYVCDMVTSEGNFRHGYHLQVLVPPKTTILLTCKAVAGKPAAQISWTPEGDCVTKQEDQGNDIVSVQSTCHWEEGNVSAVTCSVSHLTGNRSLSLDLHREHENSKNCKSIQT
ncbi:LOW QUALITY PROTEIN: cell surface glycoprotein CD200 receptor 1 [Trichechus inunguis]